MTTTADNTARSFIRSAVEEIDLFLETGDHALIRSAIGELLQAEALAGHATATDIGEVLAIADGVCTYTDVRIDLAPALQRLARTRG